jgi:putative sigma-54 modulation protein
MFYRASETTDDMYASIDAAVAALERQMRKNKTRLEKRLREGAFLKEQNAAVISQEEPEEETEFEIVRSKRFPIKPMTPEEAILQMNLLDHTFFVFRNQDNDEHVAVVYRRNHGGYGLIEED